MRLIDADKLNEHKFLSVDNPNVKKYYPKTITEYQKGWNDAIDAIIDNAPTVEPDCLHCKQYQGGYDYGFNIGYNKGKSERPTGKWRIERTYRGETRYTCSNCSHAGGARGFNFCPNCGVKMLRGDEE